MTTTTSGIHRDDATTTTTSEQGKRVAGVAADEAQNVAAEAKDQVRRLVDDTRDQASDQARTQRDRLVDTLRTFGDDLDQMTTQSSSSGLASEVTRRAAEHARAISSSLEGREPADLLQDLRGFARRRPGMFLLGALAAGIVAGRMARGAAASTGSSTSGSLSGATTTDVSPVATNGYPNVPPASPALADDDLGAGPTTGAGFAGPDDTEPSPYTGGSR